MPALQVRQVALADLPLLARTNGAVDVLCFFGGLQTQHDGQELTTLAVTGNGLRLPAGGIEAKHQVLVKRLDQVIDLDALAIAVDRPVGPPLLLPEISEREHAVDKAVAQTFLQGN